MTDTLQQKVQKAIERLRAFDRMLKARDESGRKTDLWTDAQSVMNWWLSG